MIIFFFIAVNDLLLTNGDCGHLFLGNPYLYRVERFSEEKWKITDCEMEITFEYYCYAA